MNNMNHTRSWRSATILVPNIYPRGTQERKRRVVSSVAEMRLSIWAFSKTSVQSWKISENSWQNWFFNRVVLWVVIFSEEKSKISSLFDVSHDGQEWNTWAILERPCCFHIERDLSDLIQRFQKWTRASSGASLVWESTTDVSTEPSVLENFNLLRPERGSICLCRLSHFAWFFRLRHF